MKFASAWVWRAPRCMGCLKRHNNENDFLCPQTGNNIQSECSSVLVFHSSYLARILAATTADSSGLPVHNGQGSIVGALATTARPWPVLQGPGQYCRGPGQYYRGPRQYCRALASTAGPWAILKGPWPLQSVPGQWPPEWRRQVASCRASLSSWLPGPHSLRPWMGIFFVI